ncbi:hypothetical protein K0U27_01435 [archaeon]|nr:hypothetical protein [archaeon]
MKYTNNKRPPVPSSISTSHYGGDGSNGDTGGAKNHWVKIGHLWKLNICSYNVRTLIDNERLAELEEELKDINWDIIGLSEIRRKQENKLLLKSGNVLYWKGTNNKSQHGTGFLINKNIVGNITTYTAVNERMSKIIIQISKKYKIQIIQVYAPTSSYPDEEVEDFYNELGNFMRSDSNQMTIIILML